MSDGCIEHTSHSSGSLFYIDILEALCVNLISSNMSRRGVYSCLNLKNDKKLRLLNVHRSEKESVISKGTNL